MIPFMPFPDPLSKLLELCEGVLGLINFLLLGASCSLNSSVLLLEGFRDFSSSIAEEILANALASCLAVLDSFLIGGLTGGESWSDDGCLPLSWKAICGVEDWESFFSEPVLDTLK